MNDEIETENSVKQRIYDERLTSKGFVEESMLLSIDDRFSSVVFSEYANMAIKVIVFFITLFIVDKCIRG